MCASCLAKANQHTNQVRQQRRVAGLCRDCGEPAGSYARCLKHRGHQQFRYWLKQWKHQRQQQEEQERIWERTVMVWNGWEYAQRIMEE